MFKMEPPPPPQRRHKPTLNVTFNGSKAVFRLPELQNKTFPGKHPLKITKTALFIVRSDLRSLIERSYLMFHLKRKYHPSS